MGIRLPLPITLPLSTRPLLLLPLLTRPLLSMPLLIGPLLSMLLLIMLLPLSTRRSLSHTHTLMLLLMTTPRLSSVLERPPMQLEQSLDPIPLLSLMAVPRTLLTLLTTTMVMLLMCHMLVSQSTLLPLLPTRPQLHTMLQSLPIMLKVILQPPYNSSDQG